MLTDLKKTNLLLIEDDLEYTESNMNVLQRFVSKIFHATNSTEALELLELHRIDFIISDIYLSNSDNGLDFIEYLRQYNTNIPIIVISGHQDIEYLLRSIRLNLAAYIIKPITYDALIEALCLCSKKLHINKTNMHRRLVKNDWIYDISTKYLIKEDVSYRLNKKEVLFIEMVLNNKNSVITKDMFYEHVWEFKEMSDAALKNFILRMRKRFGKDFITVINNIGYRFVLYYCIGSSILGKSHSVHSYILKFNS